MVAGSAFLGLLSCWSDKIRIINFKMSNRVFRKLWWTFFTVFWFYRPNDKFKLIDESRKWFTDNEIIVSSLVSRRVSEQTVTSEKFLHEMNETERCRDWKNNCSSASFTKSLTLLFLLSGQHLTFDLRTVYCTAAETLSVSCRCIIRLWIFTYFKLLLKTESQRISLFNLENKNLPAALY